MKVFLISLPDSRKRRLLALQNILQYHPLCEKPIDHLYAELSHIRNCFETISPIVAIASGLGSDIHDF